MLSARGLAQKKELLYQYNALLKMIPDLKTDIHLISNEELETLAEFVRQPLLCPQRTTDVCPRFRNQVAKLVAPTQATWSTRLLRTYARPRRTTGFRMASQSSRPYCPKPCEVGRTFTLRARSLRQTPYPTLRQTGRSRFRFEGIAASLTYADRFAEEVSEKTKCIVAEDFPSFLFDVRSFNDDDLPITDSLLRGDLFKMVRCYLRVPASLLLMERHNHSSTSPYGLELYLLQWSVAGLRRPRGNLPSAFTTGSRRSPHAASPTPLYWCVHRRPFATNAIVSEQLFLRRARSSQVMIGVMSTTFSITSSFSTTSSRCSPRRCPLGRRGPLIGGTSVSLSCSSLFD